MAGAAICLPLWGLNPFCLAPLRSAAKSRRNEKQVHAGPRRSQAAKALPEDEAVLENGERQGGGGALGKGASDPGTIQRRVSGEGAGVKRKQQLGAWERRAPAPASSQAGVAGPAGKARRVGLEHSSSAHKQAQAPPRQQYSRSSLPAGDVRGVEPQATAH